MVLKLHQTPSLTIFYQILCTVSRYRMTWRLCSFYRDADLIALLYIEKILIQNKLINIS
uniref:Uncharacterized protein n=1 Tax=Arundo donax TaxID=35708 RepID=A0A0A9E2Z8_ARUDO